jgi:hypothetical protein
MNQEERVHKRHNSALAKSVSDQNNKVGQFIEQVIESKVGI